MRVIILGTRGFPHVQGGVEKHSEQLSINLVRIGCGVIVFRRRPYVDPKLDEYQGVKLVTLPSVKLREFETILHTFIGVFAAIKYKPDVLHFQAIGSALFIPLSRMLGFRVVLTTHGSNYQHQKWGRLAKSVFKVGEYLGMKFANQVIAISKTIADEMEAKYKRRPIVIPNGVEHVQIRETEEALRKYGLEKGKYIITVGRFVKGKGFEDLIEAYKKVHGSSLTAYKLVIVGDADHEDAYSRGLKQNAQENGNIVLTGFLTGQLLQELYSHAGLFVLPSYYEGLPIALLEAMSYGLSCVVSDIPANREVDLCEERYFKPGDINALAAKIAEYAGKPMSIEEKTRQVKLISERYDWEKIAEKTLRVYEGVGSKE